MKAEILKVTKRDPKGSKSAARIRRNGNIPAVLYGGGKDTVHVSVPLEPFEFLLRKHRRVLNLEVEGSQALAFLKDVQHDALGDDIVHIDFLRVDEKKRMRVSVPLVFTGHAKGLGNGGEFVHPLNELEVECLPSEIPESLKVAVDHLDVGNSLHAREVALPNGVSLVTDPEAIIATVHLKGLEPEAGATPAEGGPAEPERIAKPVAEDAEGEAPAKK